MRMAASTEAPFSPISFHSRLRARGRIETVSVGVSMGADTKANTRGRGALEVGDLRLLEDGGEHGGALGSNVVAGEAARDR